MLCRARAILNLTFILSIAGASVSVAQPGVLSDREMSVDEPATEPPLENRDSDGDGLSDRDEDLNHDGVVDEGETDPHESDTDGDGQVDSIDLAPAHLEIPEPMVFDLVRGLGARAGEVEINTLVLTGSPGHADTLRYAPEIEIAFANGFGLELELPMEGEHVEAIKGAVQGRISTADEGRWMHGFQVIGEYGFSHENVDAHVLWIVSGLLTSELAMVGMLGGRITFVGDRVSGCGIVNLSGFHAVGEDVWLGAELNLSWNPHIGEVAVRAIPQVHVSFQRAFRVQLGLGVEHAGVTHPVGGARLIVEM